MNQDQKEYIANRCETYLSNNKEYMDIQRRMSEAFSKNDIKSYSDLSLSLQTVVELAVYRIAANDICEFFTSD